MMLFLECKRKMSVNLKNKSPFVLCPGAFESLRGCVSKWNEIADVAIFPSAPASFLGLSNGLESQAKSHPLFFPTTTINDRLFH